MDTFVIARSMWKQSKATTGGKAKSTMMLSGGWQ